MPFIAEVKEGILVFPDIGNYETAVEFLTSLESEKIPYWEDNLSFVSMRKAFNSEKLAQLGFDDEVLATLVNPDGYIQIGDYLFNINMLNSKVEVVKLDKGIFFENDLKSQNHMTFNTHENIFAILYGDEITLTEKSSCDSNNTDWRYLNTSDGQVQYRVRYYKAGIYFTLRARIEKESGSGGYVDMYMRTWSHWTFARRNSSNCITFAGYEGGSGSSYSMRAWSSIYSLSAYKYIVDFTINDHATGSQYNFNLGISCNPHNDCSQ